MFGIYSYGTIPYGSINNTMQTISTEKIKFGIILRQVYKTDIILR